jgi:hypothetical protein
MRTINFVPNSIRPIGVEEHHVSIGLALIIVLTIIGFILILELSGVFEGNLKCTGPKRSLLFFFGHPIYGGI